MIIQLNPPLWLITPKGRGLAVALIDYGFDHDLLWVVFQKDTGECWTWSNPNIRADKNITLGFNVGSNDNLGSFKGQDGASV